MKKNYLPALIMLAAGAVDCVLSFVQRLTPLAFTRRLLLVLLIFYALGTVVQWVVNANFSQTEDEHAPETADGETAEEEPEEDAGYAGMEQEEIENINAENSVE